jgi:hypothetical protein
MARRVVIEEPCDHGLVTGPHEFNPDCPGGSRHVLDPGSYVLIEKVDGEWPEDALDDIVAWLVKAGIGSSGPLGELLDALAGDERP